MECNEVLICQCVYLYISARVGPLCKPSGFSHAAHIRTEQCSGFICVLITSLCGVVQVQNVSTHILSLPAMTWPFRRFKIGLTFWRDAFLLLLLRHRLWESWHDSFLWGIKQNPQKKKNNAWGNPLHVKQPLHRYSNCFINAFNGFTSSYIVILACWLTSCNVNLSRTFELKCDIYEAFYNRVWFKCSVSALIKRYRCCLDNFFQLPTLSTLGVA